MNSKDPAEDRPVLVIKTIEGRRSQNRPVLTDDRYATQLKVLASRGVTPPPNLGPHR